MLVQRGEVPDHRVGERGIDAIMPRRASVRAGAQVELVDHTTTRVGVVAQRTLQNRIESLAIDAERHALEPAAGPA